MLADHTIRTMRGQAPQPEMSLQKQSALLIFAILLGFSIAFWWQPLHATARLALENEEYTHILIVLPLSVVLIYPRWGTIVGVLRPNLPCGVPLLVAALLVAAVARWGLLGLAGDLRLSLEMLTLVTWWIASFLCSFGLPAFRSCLFPFGFLLWMVPLPAAALDRILPFLQNQSALTAQILFRIAGVPATRDGVFLDIPGLGIEVARECSSIRSSLFLIVTTMLLAQLFLRSWWRKALVIAASIPLSVAKNGLRIFVIAELATRVDPGYLDSNLHHHGGIVFLAIAQAVIVALIWILYSKEAAAPD